MKPRLKWNKNVLAAKAILFHFRHDVSKRKSAGLRDYWLLSVWQGLSARYNYIPVFVKPSQLLLSDVITKRTTFSQPFLPPSDRSANAPWFFLRYRRYVNHLLTYLLTYGVWLCTWIRRDSRTVEQLSAGAWTRQMRPRSRRTSADIGCTCLTSACDNTTW